MSWIVRTGVACLLFAAGTLHADSWLPPKVETYTSSDGRARVVIFPRPLDGALSYFSDKVDGREPAGQLPESQQLTPLARLERLEGRRWREVWTVPLVNDVSPVSALVANDGQHLVTFDNWHSAGFGSDVVVIYDGEGNLVRKMGLTDFLPESYVQVLPSTVSSLWWAGSDHSLVEDDGVLVLQVLVPSEKRLFESDPETVSLRVRLIDGEVLPHEGDGWDRATKRVAALDAKRQQRWQQKRALRSRPLLPPAGNDYDEWRAYMVELRERLNEATGTRTGGLVLPAPGDSGRGVDGERGITIFLDEYVDARAYATEAYVFVSPSSEALADLLARHLSSKDVDAMKGAVIHFVGTPEQGKRVEVAAVRSGATISLIDKSVPFPPAELPVAAPAWFK